MISPKHHRAASFYADLAPGRILMQLRLRPYCKSSQNIKNELENYFFGLFLIGDSCKGKKRHFEISVKLWIT
jgi:hypothetical protein